MDADERTALIRALHAEMVRSAKAALEASEKWNRRSLAIQTMLGKGTPEHRIAKRDDQALKDHMAVYQWHAGNAGFASGVIGTLLSPAVQEVVG